MKTFSAAAFSSITLSLAATPASATQGQLCRPSAGAGPTVSIVIGSLGIAGVTVTERGASRTTMGEGAALALRQSWIDEQRLWIDLTDANHMRDEGRLRLQFTGAGRASRLAGTFVRGGRLHRLRCEES